MSEPQRALANVADLCAHRDRVHGPERRDRPELDDTPETARAVHQLADVDRACDELCGPPDADDYGAPTHERVRAAITGARACSTRDALAGLDPAVLVRAMRAIGMPCDERDARDVIAGVVAEMGEGT